MILAIDTTSGSSAAVVNRGEVLGFSGFDDPFGHAENIGQAIESAMSEAKVTGKEIEVVAISRGPASYTGLRVGMAAGLAFATARKIPLLGVVSLDAVASIHGAGIDNKTWLVTSDAKRGEQFVGVYSGLDGNGLAERQEQLQVMKPEDLEKNYGSFPRISELCDAKVVGIYAEKADAAGVKLDDLSALYLRSPDVTPSSKKRVSG